MPPRNGLEYFKSAGADLVSCYWEVCGPRAVEAILAEVDARAPGKTNFSLWIQEHLTLQREEVAPDLAMAVVLDRLLALDLFPAGFEQYPGGRVYRYTLTA